MAKGHRGHSSIMIGNSVDNRAETVFTTTMTRHTGNNYSGPRFLFAEGRKSDIANQHRNGVHTDCDRSTCDHWNRVGGGVSIMGGSNRPTAVHHDHPYNPDQTEGRDNVACRECGGDH